MKEFSLIKCLKNEQELLVESIEKARKEGNIGTYKNLVNALRDVTKIIQENEIKEEVWLEKYSKYTSDGLDMVSTWEQKGDKVRNIKEYVVSDCFISDTLYKSVTQCIEYVTPTMGHKQRVTGEFESGYIKFELVSFNDVGNRNFECKVILNGCVIDVVNQFQTVSLPKKLVKDNNEIEIIPVNFEGKINVWLYKNSKLNS